MDGMTGSPAGVGKVEVGRAMLMPGNVGLTGCPILRCASCRANNCASRSMSPMPAACGSAPCRLTCGMGGKGCDRLPAAAPIGERPRRSETLGGGGNCGDGGGGSNPIRSNSASDWAILVFYLWLCDILAVAIYAILAYCALYQIGGQHDGANLHPTHSKF